MLNIHFLLILIFAVILFVIYAYISRYGISKLFPESGDPASIAKSFSEMLRTYGQIIVGLFVILSLVALLLENKIASDAAIPVISLIAGYILGNGAGVGNFRDKGENKR